MNIVQRGNPAIMKSIREQSEQISIAKGLKKPMIQENGRPTEGGAANSIAQIRNQSDMNQISQMFGNSTPTQQTVQAPTFVTPQVANSVSNNARFSFENSIKTQLSASIEALPATKEYFSVAQSLFTLYAMGDLTVGVLDRISKEDLREIKAIVREFKSELDSY